MSTFQLLAHSPGLFACICLLLGMLIGSFLNVVIHRLPVMLRRDWRQQSMEILSEWAAEKSASAELVQMHSGLQRLGSGLAAAPVYNLIAPRSACPHCGHPIGALQNVPVLSFLILRGRCAGCRARISPRYPVIEALTGLVSA